MFKTGKLRRQANGNCQSLLHSEQDSPLLETPYYETKRGKNISALSAQKCLLNVLQLSMNSYIFLRLIC